MSPRPIISQRCQNCRRRKKRLRPFRYPFQTWWQLTVQCDGQKPACGSCKRLLFKCEPYRKQFVFVADSQSTKKRRLVQASQPFPLATDTSISSPALRTTVFYQFMFGCLSKPFGELETCAMTWMSTIMECGEQLQYMKLAAGALSLKAMGVAIKDRACHVQSMELYGKAAAQLRKATFNIDKENAFQILVTSVALVLYELFNPTGFCDPSACRSYGMGVASLLQFMGPQAFTDPSNLYVFMHSRIIMNSNALLIERQLYPFVNLPEWLHVPWSVIPKSDYQQAIDCLLLVPDVLEAASNILDDTKSDKVTPSDLESFIKVFKYVDSCLDMWYEDVTARRGRLLTVLHQVEYPEGHIKAMRFAFKNLDDGQALQSYWTGKLFSHRAYCRVAHRFDIGVDAMADEFRAMRPMADNILRSLPQFLHKSSGFVGLKYCVVPLAAAVKFYDYHDMQDGLDCAHEYIDVLVDGGIEFTRFLAVKQTATQETQANLQAI